MMKVLNSKKAMSEVTKIILAVIGFFVIFVGVVYPAVDYINNPPGDGTACRLAIQVAARTEEFTQGIKATDFKESCKTIEKTLPLHEVYLGKKVGSMNADEFNRAIQRDFVELIARAWYITKEGDRPDYLLTKLEGFFNNKNNCLVVYAVRIHADQLDYPGFQGITQERLRAALGNYTKAEIFGSSLSNPQTIAEYITFSGSGGAVFVNGIINLKQGGADALYGIAVGFKKIAGLDEKLKGIFGTNPDVINSDSSFILIAPYDKIASMCDINEK
jgi:hypothetical protein